jgi:hypothetical protein
VDTWTACRLSKEQLDQFSKWLWISECHAMKTLSFFYPFIISYFFMVCCLPSSFYSVLVRSIKMTENTVIKEVLNNPFSMRRLHDELTILYIKMKCFFLYVWNSYKFTFLNRSEPNFARISPLVWKRP